MGAAVEQYHVQAYFRGTERNARAHHACAQNAEFLDALIGDIGWADSALADLALAILSASTLISS